MHHITKEFKTFEEQKDLLKSYSLKIKDENAVIDTLKRINYFDLINGFESIYSIKNSGPNLPKKTFNDIYFEELVQLYRFDKELGSKIFLEISKFEEQLKTLISYYFAKKNCRLSGETMNYLNYEKYAEPLDKKLLEAFKRFKVFKRNPQLKYEYSYLKSITKKFPFVNCYDNPPFWVTIKTYDMGSLYFTYEFLTDDIKEDILKDFGFTINEKELFGQMIWIVKDFRNVCAHSALITHLRIQTNSSYINKKATYLNHFSELYSFLGKNVSDKNLTLFDLLCVLKNISLRSKSEINIANCIQLISNNYSYFSDQNREEVFNKLLVRMGNGTFNEWKNLQ